MIKQLLPLSFLCIVGFTAFANPSYARKLPLKNPSAKLNPRLGNDKCNGSSDCKVCTDCSRCEYCKTTGTCGACQPYPATSPSAAPDTGAADTKNPNEPKPLGKIKAEVLIEGIEGDVQLYFKATPATSPIGLTLDVDTYRNEIKPDGTTVSTHLLSQGLTADQIKAFLAQPNVLKPTEKPETLDDKRTIYLFTVQGIKFRLTERRWYELCEVIRRAAGMAEK